MHREARPVTGPGRAPAHAPHLERARPFHLRVAEPVFAALAAGYDLVIPSLPGFGFSRELGAVPRHRPMRRTAALLWQLMTDVLGYRQFGVAGGDGGSVLAQILAIEHPEAILGI